MEVLRMEKEYSNVLVAVDGSEQSYNAVHEAIDLAKRKEAKLHIVTVKELEHHYGMTGFGLVENPEIDLIAHDILKKTSEIIGEEVDFDTYELVGAPKHMIVQFAEDHKFDLIVMGATGAGMINKLVLGSTTQFVVNHAPCNVLVVK